MALDGHKNFAVSAIAVAPSPPGTGTSVTVRTTEGGLFPTPPFNATVWPAATIALASNAEIVRCTAKNGDVLTITRGQEGSVARTIAVGDNIAATFTAKMIDDIATAIQNPPSPVTVPGVSPSLTFRDTTQGTDLKSFQIADINQTFRFAAVNDAVSAVTATPLLLDRAGAAKIGTDLYEKGRITPIGHWIAVPFNAADYYASAGGTWTVGSAAAISNRYTLIGKTLLWSIYVSWFSGSNTLTGTPAQLVIRVPNGFQPGFGANRIAFMIDGNGAAVEAYASQSGTTIVLGKTSGANWAAGAPGFMTMMSWELQ